MKKVKQEVTVRQLIDEINRKLEMIEDYMAFTILAERRFKVGQRVEFSRSAKRNGVSKAKGGVTKGTVKKVDGFIITVHLDGYKKPSGFHHAYFNPVVGPKLF